MGDIGDFLMGSSEDAKQVGTAETLLPEQKNLLKQLTGLMSGQLESGEIKAPMSALQRSSFDVVGDLLKSPVIGAGQEALSGLLQPFDPTSTTDFFNKAVKAPTLQMFEEDILPSVQERFIGQGLGRSGGAQAALSKAGSDVATGLSEQLANLLYSGEQSHLGRQLPAIQQSLGGLQLGLGAGAQETDTFLNLLRNSLGTKAFEPIVQGPTQQEGFLPTLTGAAAQVLPFFL